MDPQIVFDTHANIFIADDPDNEGDAPAFVTNEDISGSVLIPAYPHLPYVVRCQIFSRFVRSVAIQGNDFNEIEPEVVDSSLTPSLPLPCDGWRNDLLQFPFIFHAVPLPDDTLYGNRISVRYYIRVECFGIFGDGSFQIVSYDHHFRYARISIEPMIRCFPFELSVILGDHFRIAARLRTYHFNVLGLIVGEFYGMSLSNVHLVDVSLVVYESVMLNGIVVQVNPAARIEFTDLFNNLPTTLLLGGPEMNNLYRPFQIQLSEFALKLSSNYPTEDVVVTHELSLEARIDRVQFGAALHFDEPGELMYVDPEFGNDNHPIVLFRLLP